MSDATPLSPLRRVLCSHSNAIRVAAWMRRAGIETDIVATGAPLQPWQVIEATSPRQRTPAHAKPPSPYRAHLLDGPPSPIPQGIATAMQIGGRSVVGVTTERL
jgi:hypothetical protein